MLNRSLESCTWDFDGIQLRGSGCKRHLSCKTGSDCNHFCHRIAPERVRRHGAEFCMPQLCDPVFRQQGKDSPSPDGSIASPRNGASICCPRAPEACSKPISAMHSDTTMVMIVRMPMLDDEPRNPAKCAYRERLDIQRGSQHVEHLLQGRDGEVLPAMAGEKNFADAIYPRVSSTWRFMSCEFSWYY